MASFSIIVPVYQSENYLERCLVSLKNQTYSNMEVIMIDDGSTDNSYNICYEFSSQDNRFILIHQENRGVSSARNAGLKRATKEYVIFVDSDDYVSLNYLEILNKVVEEKIDVCFCTKYYTIKGNCKEKIELRSYSKCHEWKSQKEVFEKFAEGEIAFPTAVLNCCCRREMLQMNDIWFEPKYTHSEDSDFNFKVCMYFKRCGWLEPACYYYNLDNENSATHKGGFSGLNTSLFVWKKWFYYCKNQEAEVYKKWAEYFSICGNHSLINGRTLEREQQKKLFCKNKEWLEFYQGNTIKIYKVLLFFYVVFHYENIIPIVNFLTKIRRKLRQKMKL